MGIYIVCGGLRESRGAMYVAASFYFYGYIQLANLMFVLVILLRLAVLRD